MVMLIKFGKKEHLEQLKNGIVHFSPIELFQEDPTDFRGDKMEGKHDIDTSKPVLINGTDISMYIKEAVVSHELNCPVCSFSASLLSYNNCHINGSTRAYPDLIAMTTGGKILMIETKGDHLDNDDSKAKAKIGQQWDMLAGSKYRYFMVFQSKAPDFQGAYSYDQFMEIAKGI